jgi:hypothetical protein
MVTTKQILVPTSLFLIIVFLAGAAGAETAIDSNVVNKRNLGGPRFGMTYVPGNSQLTEELEFHDMGRVISQFGWHFEHQVMPRGGGPQFVIEFVPMLAGVEYGKVIPSFTLAMGLRTPGGLEFGMGPNLMFSKTVDNAVEARTSLILVVGKSFNYGGVSIPVNLAYSTAPEGNRVSVIFGYAIGSTPKPVLSERPHTSDTADLSRLR